MRSDDRLSNNGLSDKELKRMRWHSRRGMLELDLILVPFADHRLGEMDEEQRQRYRELLLCEDQDLYAWLVGREAPPQALKPTIDQIVAYTRATTPSGQDE